MIDLEEIKTAWSSGELGELEYLLSQNLGELTPRDVAQLRLDFAREALQLGNADKVTALALMAELPSSSNKLPADIRVQILHMRARLHASLGERDQAIEFYTQAVLELDDIDPLSSYFDTIMEEISDTLGDGSKAFLDQLSVLLGARDNSLYPAADSSGGEDEQIGKEVDSSGQFELVPVHYTTSRNRTGRSDYYDYFRGDYSELSFGKALVTVPTDRPPGMILHPPPRQRTRANPAVYFVIKDIRELGSHEELIESAKQEMGVSKHKEALLFVHGYNTSFSSALKRSAQLSVDLEIDGPTFLYSWPSRANVMSYFLDRARVGGGDVPALSALILDIAQKCNAEKVHLIGHSMGSEFLFDALLEARTALSASSERLAEEVIFASPDIPLDRFVARVPEIKGLAGRISVYSSEKDKALGISSVLQGARAGRSPSALAKCDVDSISTGSVSRGLGHDDFAGPAIDDVRAVIWTPFSPEKRRSILVADQEENFWHFRKERPLSPNGGGAFRRALYYIRRLGIGQALPQIERQIEVVRDRLPNEHKLLKAVRDELAEMLESS